MCICENMLTNYSAYLCRCGTKDNDCKVDIEYVCIICGWKVTHKCMICTVCHPHDDELHKERAKSQCYDCGVSPFETPEEYDDFYGAY